MLVNPEKPFLTAEWRYLAMLNYEVDPAVVAPFVPAGTELDYYQGKTYVSLVGFRFLKTRVMGVPIPFHRHFDEVNLRFYVRRLEGETVKRGTVFIREIVPRWAIAKIAQMAYNEKYLALPMSHELEFADGTENPALARYGWRFGGEANEIAVRCPGVEAVELAAGSHEEFIAEHYWGYSVQRDGGTVEYRVEHPRWRMWPVTECKTKIDIDGLYGAAFAVTLDRRAVSAFVAEGSAVRVFQPRRLVL